MNTERDVLQCGASPVAAALSLLARRLRRPGRSRMHALGGGLQCVVQSQKLSYSGVWGRRELSHRIHRVLCNQAAAPAACAKAGSVAPVGKSPEAVFAQLPNECLAV